MNAAELAGRLGLRKTRIDFRGDCPSCGYHGSFRVRGRVDETARAACWSCNDYPGIASALNAITCSTWKPPAERTPESAAERQTRSIQWGRAYWDRTGPLGPPAIPYLHRRGIGHVATSPVLRSLASARHSWSGTTMPVMVARVQDVAGDTVGVHRTFLTIDGHKTTLEPDKAFLGHIWGGAIRLQPPDPARPLVVAEGVESAASAGLLLQAPAWAALAVGNMADAMVLPDEVRDVLIAADPDEEGERGAQTAAARWRAQGRTVRIVRVTGSGDWNDLLIRELRLG